MKAIAGWMSMGALLFLAACSASANEPAPPPQEQGSLFVSWTFDQRSDPAACNASNLDMLQVDVTTEDMQTTAGQIASPCTSLVGAVALLPGRYVGTAHFVDAEGEPRSSMIQTKHVEVVAGDRVNAKLDFSGDSIY